MTGLWSERAERKPELGVVLGLKRERLVLEEHLLETLVDLGEALLRPRDALFDQARLLAEPILAHAGVVLDLAGGHPGVLLDRLCLAAGLGEDLLDLLVGL